MYFLIGRQGWLHSSYATQTIYLTWLPPMVALWCSWTGCVFTGALSLPTHPGSPGAAGAPQLLIPVRTPRRISLQNNKSEKTCVEHRF